ncbi:MAG TPA: allantoate amidohydrolase [Usitatibacter sp.]|nr:allantoate amidohydrolase [Usitatibacter sp.]
MPAPDFDATAAGRALLDRAQALARHSDSPAHYTRTFLTPAHRAAARQIAEWMAEAGLAVRTDAVGSVIGRYDGAPGGRTLLMGSHFDSVRNGGKYDGVLGILVPIACVAELHRRGERLPVALEVAAFSDEEGARFQTSFLSSRALVGRFDRAVLERRDAEGVAFADAMREAGLDPAKIDAARIDAQALAAYVEVHIEQGPVLLGRGAPLGVVTSIAGGSRHTVHVRGEAGHAGTVPMTMRHDALAAAAEMVLAVEQRCGLGGTLVGTVGILKVRDGTGNVIPGEVEFTCDIRAGDDATRHVAERDVFAAFERIAARRGVRIEKTRTHEVRAAACAGWLQERLAAAIRATGAEPVSLPSGAGHDAMILAEATDVGMLFVRCGAGGVSHNPAETITAEDAGLAAGALLRFLRGFAE